MRRLALFPLLAALGCGSASPTAAVNVAPPPAPKKVDPPPPPRPPATKKGAAPSPEQPIPPKLLTFEEAYAEAVKMGAELDRQEPKATADALKLLTVGERVQFQSVDGPPGILDLPGTVSTLRQIGMTARLERNSRAVARGDDDFKTVAKSLWEPPSGADGVLRMMNTWGTIRPLWRPRVVHAVRNNSPTVQLNPETRDAILEMGGRAWLAR